MERQRPVRRSQGHVYPVSTWLLWSDCVKAKVRVFFFVYKPFVLFSFSGRMLGEYRMSGIYKTTKSICCGKYVVRQKKPAGLDSVICRLCVCFPIPWRAKHANNIGEIHHEKLIFLTSQGWFEMQRLIRDLPPPPNPSTAAASQCFIWHSQGWKGGRSIVSLTAAVRGPGYLKPGFWGWESSALCSVCFVFRRHSLIWLKAIRSLHWEDFFCCY